jgi:transcriptional regulator with XRE-family HTH domain
MAKISGRMITRYETEGVIPPSERLQTLVDALEIPVARLFEHAAEPPDARSVKKLRDILSMPDEDRNDLYRILNKHGEETTVRTAGTVLPLTWAGQLHKKHNSIKEVLTDT